MGHRKLCLLLLLSCCARARKYRPVLVHAHEDVTSRFKAFRKYVYRYSTESRNSATGAADLRDGHALTCQVEVEVPHPCKFIMHTRGCTLRPAPSSDAFQACGGVMVWAFGPLTTLTVPSLCDLSDLYYPLFCCFLPLQSTVHGQCVTLVNSSSDVATGVTLVRDLSQCDQFYSRELTNSPLALPMSKLITSTQSCSYQFDRRERHITTASCTENHSYRDSTVSSELTPLHFEDPEDKSPVQTGDDVLTTLRELVTLAGSDQGQKRAGLFHKLVSGLRALRNETLSRAVPEMRAASGWLTWQALFQCGTSECTSAILQIIRTIDGVSLETDALVYALSLRADPDAARVRDMLSMAQYKQSKPIMYALANTVKKIHKNTVTPEVTDVLTDVSKFMEVLLNDCSVPRYDSDPVVGVMGQAMQAVSPSLISSILRCAKKAEVPLSHQKAAIQAFRRMDVSDEVKSLSYMDTDSSAHFESEIPKLQTDKVRNSLSSRIVSWEYTELALNGQLSPTGAIFDGVSRNYKLDSSLGSIQSNVIFDGSDTLPKEMMLETTLKVFDYSYDIFEVGVEGTGFEPTIDALFGERGFLPESMSRLMYLVQDKVLLVHGATTCANATSHAEHRLCSQIPEDFLKDMADRIQRLVNDVSSSPAPEAAAYLRLLGNEIGYLKTGEMRKMFETLFMYYHVFIRVLPAQVRLSVS
uniref:Vitellogenin domain-containing protein n=1 Tax=Neolamprologus brichardi TaxID=32507 RepID=A0A3Q4GQ24_NEOBR